MGNLIEWDGMNFIVFHPICYFYAFTKKKLRFFLAFTIIIEKISKNLKKNTNFFYKKSIIIGIFFLKISEFLRKKFYITGNFKISDKPQQFTKFSVNYSTFKKIDKKLMSEI